MTVWMVVLVKGGFIQEPEVFHSAADAEDRRSELALDLNPNYDELEVFEKCVDETTAKLESPTPR